MSQSETTVEIRIFGHADQSKHWRDLPVACYLPLFSNSLAHPENICKRILLLYFKQENPKIWKVRWNFRGETTGFFVDKNGVEEDKSIA